MIGRAAKVFSVARLVPTGSGFALARLPLQGTGCFPPLELVFSVLDSSLGLPRTDSASDEKARRLAEKSLDFLLPIL